MDVVDSFPSVWWESIQAARLGANGANDGVQLTASVNASRN